MQRERRGAKTLSKLATGVPGLDEITRGGVPRERTTLVLGGPGCGKTLLGLDFLAHGARADEPGVLVTVEQTREQVILDAHAVGLDLPALEQQGRLAILPIDLLEQDAVETGAYTLDGLLAAIQRAAERVGARRLVIDGLDGFFGAFEDARLLRREFMRLGRHLSEQGMTTLITASAPGGPHRMEEFLSDCVLLLDHRVINQVSTRRLRVLKYRATAHGTDEYPFAITSHGLQVFPITSATLDYEVSEETFSTGVAGLDAMLGDRGLYRGSSVLIAGPAGTGKTTLACQLAAAASAAGLRCAYFSFEESPQQLIRNAGGVGIELRRAAESHRLQLHAARPSVHGLEQHLATLHDVTRAETADLVLIDPITNLVSVGSDLQVKAMLTRLLDGFKSRQVTVVFTSLILAGDASLGADIGVSSLMDTIILLDNPLVHRRRQRTLSVLKARGLPSSQEVRDLVFGADGITLRPGPGADGGEHE